MINFLFSFALLFTSVWAIARENPPARQWLQRSGAFFTENKGQVFDTEGKVRPDIRFTAEGNGGGSLLSASYYSGSLSEAARSIAVRGNNVIVVGQTSSLNFPVQNSFQQFCGGNDDAFVLAAVSDSTQAYTSLPNNTDCNKAFCYRLNTTYSNAGLELCANAIDCGGWNLNNFTNSPCFSAFNKPLFYRFEVPQGLFEAGRLTLSNISCAEGRLRAAIYRDLGQMCPLGSRMPGSVACQSDRASINFDNIAPGSYYLVIDSENEGGCSWRIEDNFSPRLSFITSTCQSPLSLRVQPQAQRQNVQYSWSGPQNFFATGSEVIVPVTANTLGKNNYTLKVDYLPASACRLQTFEYTQEGTIHVLPPVPLVTEPSPVVSCTPRSLLFTVNTPDPGNNEELQIASNPNFFPATTQRITQDVLFYPTPEIRQTTTYFFRRINLITGCTSQVSAAAATFLASVLATPVVENITLNVTDCLPRSVTFTVSALDGNLSDRILLFTAPDAVTPLATYQFAPNLTIPILEPLQNTQTFYFARVNTQTGCTTERTSAIATINRLSNAAPPIVSDFTYTQSYPCEPVFPRFNVFIDGGNFQDRVLLYDISLGGAPLINVPYSPTVPLSPAAPITRTTVYYVERVNTATQCTSARIPVRATINSLPQSVSVIQNGPLCLNPTANLRLIATPLSGVNYTWRSPENIIIGTTSSVNALLSRPLTGFYKLEISREGCLIYTDSVFVQVNRPIAKEDVSIFSNSPVCEGSAIQLTTNAFANAIYQWTGPSAFASTLKDVSIINSITALHQGNYTLTVTVPGCPAVQAESFARVLPRVQSLPLISAPEVVCAGNNFTLSTAITPDLDFFWEGPAGFVSSGASNIIAAVSSLQTGNYYLYARQRGAGCSTLVTSKFITVNEPLNGPLFLQTNAPVCEGSLLRISAINAFPNAAYTWSFGSTSQRLSRGEWVLEKVLPSQTGFYKVRIDIPACPSREDSIFVEVYRGINRSRATVNSPVCLGSRLNFSAPITEGATYRWQNNITQQVYTDAIFSKLAEVSDNTFFSLTVTYRDCEPLFDTIPVLVNPPVRQPVEILGADSVCIGENIRLQVVDAEPGVKYKWLGPNWESEEPILSRANSNVNMTGAYTLRAYREGCPEVIQIKDIYVKPRIQARIRSANSFCAGSTIELAADSVPGAVYKWTLPDDSEQEGRILKIEDVDSTKAGVYRVLIEDAICGNQLLEKQIDVNTYPDSVKLLISDTAVCKGRPIVFDATEIPGATYTWFGPRNFQRTGRNFLLFNTNTTQAGRYTVQIDLPGCSPVRLSRDIMVFDNLPDVVINNNSPVCEAGELNLRANVIPGASYQWFGPGEVFRDSPSLTIADIPQDSAGVYTLVVRRGTCPPIRKTVRVTVNNPAQEVTASVSSNPICAGEDFQLRALGGSDSVKVEWRWQPGNRSNDRIVYLTAQKQYTGPVKLTVTIPGCAPKDTTFTLQVNERPKVPVISSNSPVCAARALQLSADLQDDVQYFWSGPNSFTSTLAAPRIEPASLAASGIYTLQLTRPGCAPVIATTTALVQGGGGAQATSNSPLCVGQTLRLSTQFIANAVYEWRGPNNFRSFEREPSVFNVNTFNAGVYTLTISEPGCGARELITAVSINAPAVGALVTSNSPVCVGNPILLTATQFPNATYEWRDNRNNVISTDRLPVALNASADNAGLYFVRITTPGCGTQNYSTQVTVNSAPGDINLSSNAPVCAGGNLELSASAIEGAEYRWSGPAGAQGFTPRLVIPNCSLLNEGEYFLSLTVPGCTSMVKNINVVVNENISGAISATSNSPVCAGEALQLTADLAQGATYRWFTRRGEQAGASINIPSATLADAGEYRLQVSVPGCAPIELSTVVIVQEKPSLTLLTNSPVCEGGQISLAANVISNAAYQWRGPNGFSASQRVVEFGGVSTLYAGLYTLTVNIPGCSPLQQTTNVAVGVSLNNIAIGANSPICQGQTLNLTATSLAGVTYEWRGPGNFTGSSASVQRPGATLAHSGEYQLTVTSQGCAPRILRTQVNIINQVAPQIVGSNNNGPLCAGQTLLLSATPSLQSGEYTWQWYGPGGITSRQPSLTIQPVGVGQSGVYSLVVTQPGCGTSTQTLSVTVNQNVGNVQPVANSPVCVGRELQLNSLLFATAEYRWSGPGGFTASTHNPKRPITSASQGGIYTLEVTVPGCGSTNYQLNVAVNEVIPAIVLNPSIVELCSGSELKITPNFVPEVNYNWSGPARFASANRELTIAAVTTAQAGVYTLTASRAGCESQTATATVTVNPSPQVSAIPNITTVCEGSNVTLTGISSPPAEEYLWSGPNNFSATTRIIPLEEVRIENQGQYIFEAKLGVCSSQVRTVLNVVARIPDYAFSANTPVCAGENLNLNAFSIPGANYQWSGPGGFSSTQQNPVRLSVQTNQSGIYRLVVRQGNCTLATATQSITVLSLPARPVATNNGPACPGGAAQLSANFIENAIYLWRGPGGFYSEALAPVIEDMNLSKIGEYSLQILVNGCSSAIATTRVTQSPAIDRVTIAGSASVCSGNSINLVASVVAGGVYTWTSPSGKTFSGSHLVINNAQPSDGGVYSLIVVAGNCTLPLATYNVEVLQTGEAVLLGASDASLCKGSSGAINIQVSGVGPWEITFSQNGVTQPRRILGNAGEIGPRVFSLVVSPQSNSIYALVSARDGNGCLLNTSGSAEINVLDSDLPISATNSGPVCGSGVVTFAATQYSAFNYYWTGPNGFVSDQPGFSIPVTAFDAGVYRVYAFIGNCTTKVASTMLVVTNNTPRLSVTNFPANSCVNNPTDIAISFTGLGPWSFDYVLNNGNIITVQNITSSPYTLRLIPSSAGVQQITFLRVRDGVCVAELNNQTSTFVVNPAFSLNVSSQYITGCSGSACWRINAIVEGNGLPVVYRLVERNITNTNGEFSNVSPGAYTIEAENANCKVTRVLTISDLNDGSGYTLGIYKYPEFTKAQTANTSIYVEWKGNCDVYTLRYRLRGSGSWITVPNISGNSYTISGLVSRSSYEIQVGENCKSPSTVYSEIMTLGTFPSRLFEEPMFGFAFEPQIYPNPTTGIFEIQWGKVEKGELHVRIYEIGGKMSASYSWELAESQDEFFTPQDITHLPAGVYYVELQNNARKTGLKLVLTQ